MTRDFYDWKRHIERGRNKTDRPIANNTRVCLRGEGAVAIHLHNTDVVTIHENGFVELNTGGWTTLTTKERINGYAPDGVSVYSERGEWYVYFNNPWAPVDTRSGLCREIPKPYTAPDPGPEPEDDHVGCIAGTREEFVAQVHAPVYDYDWSQDREPKSWEYVTQRFYSDGSGPRRFVHRAYITGIAYGATSHNYAWNRGEQVEVPNDWTYRQCPHCAAFRKRHDAWELAMDGARWGRGAHRGYRKMCEMLERYGSREAWQDAYITEFRAVRERRKLVNEWHRVPFYDGIMIAPDGVPVDANRPRAKQAELLLALTPEIKHENWKVAL